jgi:hypothetical protein
MCKILVPTFLTLLFQNFHCVYIYMDNIAIIPACMYACMYLCYSSLCGWLTFQYLHFCFKTLNTMYVVTIALPALVEVFCNSCLSKGHLLFAWVIYLPSPTSSKSHDILSFSHVLSHHQTS